MRMIMDPITSNISTRGDMGQPAVAGWVTGNLGND